MRCKPSIVLVFALLALVLAPATANAVQVTGDPGVNLTPVQVVYNSLFEPSPGGTIAITISGCPDNLAVNCFAQQPDLRIYLTTFEQDVGAFVHELGHYADYLLGTSKQAENIRRTFGYILGIPAYVPWFFSGTEESSSPGEEWADLYAGCAWNGPVTSNPSFVTEGYGFVVTGQQYNTVCRFFQEVLVGPSYIPAGAQPTGTIPANPFNSIWCAARTERLEYCGREGPPLPPAPPFPTAFVQPPPPPKPIVPLHHKRKKHHRHIPRKH